MELPRLVKYLLLKNKALNLDSRHTPKESGVDGRPISIALWGQRQEEP